MLVDRSLLNYSFVFTSFVLLFLNVEVTAQNVNVKLIGSPQVRCGDGSIKVSLQTSEPFEGNVYAKGFFEEKNCRVSGNGVGNVANITIPISTDCGIRRLRTIEPKGITFEISIVLMLHRKFLTKNDRAFQIQCSYVETSQRYTNKIDTLDFSASSDSSDVEKLQISSKAVVPKCRYDVLSSDGKQLIFAAVGTQLQHRWTCDCDVNDGNRNSQKLLDENGCPIDKTLMSSIDYAGDLEASYQGFVFKFADKPTVYFSCAIRLELKDVYGRCTRTSDRCPPSAPNLESSIEQFARTSLSYDADFPSPRPPVIPERSINFVTGFPDDSLLANENEDTDINDSQNFGQISVPSSAQIAETEEDENAEFLDGTSTPTDLSNEHRYASSLTADSRDEQLLDLPLPTLPIDEKELQTSAPFTSTFEPQSTKRMFGRASIEMDVNAHSIDVVDVSESGRFDQDGEPLTPRIAPRSIDVTSPRQQICVSRQTLSTSVLTAAVVLLLIAIVFCGVLWRFVRRPRVLIVPRESNTSSTDRSHQLLSAFHA
ncbi:ZP domain-containing protein [Aphelenchoides besseyi]|nr:ZP domain-containing protein [Aphelenchoides besseyi]